MVITHNLTAMNTQRQLNIVGLSKKKSTEKLSSGYKVNRAADDAAGLTISENMRRKIRGLNQAANNVQDGTSYCQIAEGALAEISDMINRIEELSVKSANGTNTDADRDALDKEMQQLVSEMDRVFKSTEFNTIKIWPPIIEPMASGAPNDYALYKVKDATGEYYGGINYMGHNYSWNDLEIGWDSTTHTFTETAEYNVSDKLIKGSSTSSPIDDYNGTAKFTIRTKKGESAEAMVKTYGWSADSDGIRVNGILVDDAKWSSSNFAGITPGGKAKAGTYSFEYYGQRIEFDVPEDMDFDDLVNTINKNQRFHIDWTSTPAKEVSVGSIESISAKNTTRIYIDANMGGHKENIANRYYVIAEDDSIVIKNSDGDKPTETVWTDLPNNGPAGTNQYGFGSWGTDVNGDGSSKSDTINGGDDNSGSSALAIDEDAKFTYATDFFGKTNNASGMLEFGFSIKENQLKQDILQDFNSVSFRQSSIVSPTTAYTNDTTQKIWVSSSSSNISFYNQRDILGRAYNNSTEEIATGTIKKGSSGYTVVLSNNGSTYELTSNVKSNAYSSEVSSNCFNISLGILNKYNDDSETERIAKFNAWLSDSSKDHFNDISSFTVKGSTTNLVNDIVLNRVSSSAITDCLDDTACDAIWGSAYTDNITYDDGNGNFLRKSDADIKALKVSLWNSMTNVDKLNVWNDSSKISASDKETIWSGLGINYAYINSKITKDDVDTLVDFSYAEKKAIYDGIRDLHLDDKVIGNKSITFNGTDGDKLTLNFDLSNITLRDVKYFTDMYGDGFLEFDHKGEGIRTAVVGDVLDKYLTYPTEGTKFNLRANGQSYQDVRFYQDHHNNGVKMENDVSVVNSPVELDIQSGAERGQITTIRYENMRAAKLGLAGEHIDTVRGARRVMDKVIYAQNKVNSERSQFGAYINGFEHCFDNINNTVENTQAAESLIRDTDMATEMVKYTKSNILEQAVLSMLSQANQTNQGILSLLQ